MRLIGASLFSLGLISSFVFSVLVLTFLYLDELNLYTAIGLTILINLVLWLISPKITDFFNRHLYKVKFITKEELKQEHPQVYSIIEKVSSENNFKFPKVGIIPDDNPTAFTYGSARFNSRIIITQGIFKYLNDNEQKAVVAHELGHVVHRDFIVMMIASILIQILYQIYSVLIRVRGRKSGYIKLIAILSYILYQISIYILYYLSRVRETLADEFSAKITSPQDLSNALIKIAYGIVSTPDDDKTARLLQSTRHMGIVDVKNAKNVGLISYETNNDPNLIAEAMVFDMVNPWAKVMEFFSTHPLTGKRIHNLNRISKKIGKPFSFDTDTAITRMKVNRLKLYISFVIGLLILILPVALFGILFFLTNLWVALIGFSIGILLKVIYSHPWGKAVETTILDQMRNVYASPIKGKAIKLNGKIIGKGIPGYVFSEDVMIQDKTGLTSRPGTIKLQGPM